MDIAVHIDDLVARMTIIEHCCNSSESASFKAHREAEAIDDIRYVPLIKAAILKEKDWRIRDSLHFILGKIGKNLSSSDAANYLISRLKNESNKYILSFMLDRIAEIPKDDDVDIKPLIILADEGRWLVRHSAIQSLNKPHDKVAEDKLINIINSDRDFRDIVYANSVLNQIGTSRAISSLEKHINSRKIDIKLSARSAIDSIKRREKTG